MRLTKGLIIQQYLILSILGFIKLLFLAQVDLFGLTIENIVGKAKKNNHVKIKKMKIGIAADHNGFELKKSIKEFLAEQGLEVVDFGACIQDDNDDYPDFVIPLAVAISARKIERGIAICGSGVGVSIAANKVIDVRAALITDSFTARQGVEVDNMNLLCLGGKVTEKAAAIEYITAFLSARFSGAERHLRRAEKVRELEDKWNGKYWRIF